MDEEIWLIVHFIPLIGFLLSLYAGWKIIRRSWVYEKYASKRIKEIKNSDLDKEIRNWYMTDYESDTSYNAFGTFVVLLFDLAVFVVCGWALFL